MFFKRNFNNLPQLSAKKRKKRLKKIPNSMARLFKSLNSVINIEGQESFRTNRPIFSDDYNDHPDSFFKSTRPAVILSQFFGVLMVHGITGKNFTTVHFKFKCWKIVYVIVLIAGNSFILACSFVENLRHGFTFERSAGIIFFSMGLITTAIFLSIAKQWQEICEEFAIVERKFQNYGYPARTGLKLKCITCVFLMAALVENTLSWSSSVLASNSPEILKTRGNLPFLHRFFLQHFYQVFSLFEFDYWKAFVIFYLNIVSTFWWNFNDLFLMLMSLSILYKFRLFNRAMFQNIGKVKTSFFWNKAREDYNYLSLLTKKVDKCIGLLMLLSFGSNLYFVCATFFKTLRNDRRTYEGVLAIYFNWSFGFLIFRTMSVALSAANLHDASKEVKTVLYSIPRQGYTVEAERLLIQIDTDEIVLTGWGLFSLTKKFLLKIAGTIMTYEIFLVQLIP